MVSSLNRKRGDSLLLLLHLLDVELKLLALEDVAVSSAGLAGSGGDAGKQSTSVELVSDVGVDGSAFLSSLVNSENVLGSLLLLLVLLAFLDLSLSELDVVVLDVELLEGGGIDLDDGVLDESLGSHELVVGGVVDDVQDSRLCREGFGAPGEVTSIEAEGSVLEVASSSSDDSGLFSSQLGVGGLSAHFKLPLLVMHGHATSGSPPLVL